MHQLINTLKYPIKLRCITDNTVFVVEQTKTEILTIRYLQSQTKQGLKSTTSEEHITKMRNSKVFVVECECVEIIEPKKPKK
jgi:hypothetical protein